MNRSEADILKKLQKSRFRASFRLDRKDLDYIERVGLEKIESHALDFVSKRLAPAHPLNDGKQTPFKGHPVFKAQHATAACCRGCLMKWHGIPKGRMLSKEEINLIVSVLMQWILNPKIPVGLRNSTKNTSIFPS